MIHDLAVYGSLAMMIVLLASILGTLHRPERYVFVGGLGLFILAHTIGAGEGVIGVLLAVAGIAIAAGATVPLLRQSV